MKLFEKIRRPRQKLEIKSQDTDLISALGLTDKVNKILLGRFAVNCAASLIAGLVAKCEFKTYKARSPTKGDEYYLWNIRPNKSQNSTQFLQELIFKLCTKNEALIFENGGELFVADSFTKKEYATLETVFSSVTRKTFIFSKTFRCSDVIYLRLNNEDAARLVDSIQAGLDSLINEAAEKYMSAGGEKIILKISSLAQGSSNFEENVKKYMNEYFVTFFEKKKAVLPLFEGYSVDKISNESEKKSDEIKGITDIYSQSMDVAAQAFKIPPAILKGNIADVSTLVDNLLTFCIDPICDQLQEEINGKRYTKQDVLSGDYMRIDTTAIKHIDILSAAANIDKLIACGMYSVDELREKSGEAPLGTKHSTEYVRTKNYESELGGVNNET